MNNNQPGRIFKQRIETSHINIPYFTITIFTHIFGQEERSRITLLTGNEFCNLFYFRRIDKGTLHTYRISSLQEEHIPLTNQTVSTRTVKNSTRVHHGRYTESDTRREVGFNRTRNDIGSRTLCSNNHVNTDSTCQLRNTGNRKFHFLTGSHNQISELVNNHYDIRHKLMPLFRIQTTVDKLLIIFSDITYMRHLQQVITGSIFSGGLGVDVAYQGFMVTCVTLAAYFIGHWMESGVWEIAASPDGVTMAFLTMSMAEIFHSFNMRSQRGSVFTLGSHNKVLWGAMLLSLVLTTGVIYLPGISDAFGFTHISAPEYAVAMALAVCVIPIVECVKFFQRKAARRRAEKQPA